MAGPRAAPENGADVGIWAKPEADSAPASLSVRRGFTCCRSWGLAGRPSSGRRSCRPGRSTPWSGSSSGDSRWSCSRGCGTSRTTASASSRSSGRRGARCRGADHRPGRRGRLPGRPAPRRPALRPLALAVPHPQGRPGDRAAGQDRLRLRPRRRAAAAEPDARPRRRRATTSRTPARSCSATPGSRAASRTSASAAGSGRSSAKASTRSTRPCSSSSPRTRVYRLELAGQARARGHGRLAERAEARSTASTRSSSAARSRRPTRCNPDQQIAGRHHRHRHGPRRPVAAPGRDHRPGRRHRRRRRALPQQLPGPRGVPRAPAAAAAGSTSPLTDGTYFINRWFATVELIPKTVVPIGYVGVVVSYYGRIGQDVSGDAFRHGERVAEGERGVWERPLGPGKYPFNTYAGNIILVPTTNFVLHWVTGKTETHRYDESLRSIDLVTQRRLRADAAAVGRRAHRLPEGPERHPAVRRREEADHADARPDAQRVLPRRRPQEDDAGAAARARRDPGTRPARSCAASSASSTSSASTC